MLELNTSRPLIAAEPPRTPQLPELRPQLFLSISPRDLEIFVTISVAALQFAFLLFAPRPALSAASSVMRCDNCLCYDALYPS